MTSATPERLRAVVLPWVIVCGAAPGAAAPTAAVTTGAGTVTAVGNLSVPRFDHSATLLPNGKVLVAGGLERNHVITASAELYDPASRRFTVTGSMSARRYGHTATLLPTGKVLIAGGCDGSSALATAELYDPASGTFAGTGALAAARCGAAAAALGSGRVLVVGGDGTPDANRLTSAELYDPSTGRFSTTGAMRTPRDQFTAIRLANDTVLVLGGSSAGRYPDATVEASAEIYDPPTGLFRPVGAMATRRYKVGAALLADGRVLVAGGSDNRDWRGQRASAEIFSPATTAFAPAGDMRAERFKLVHGMVRLPDGRVLIAGGASRPETYDPVTGAFHAVAGAALAGFYFSTVTVLRNGDALIAGGYGSDPQAGAVVDAALYRP